MRKKTIVMKGKKLRVRKAIRRNGSQFVDSSSPEVSPRKFYYSWRLLYHDFEVCFEESTLFR